MRKLHGKIKSLSFTQFIAFVTLILLLGAIFITINSTLQQKTLRSSAAALPVGSALPSEADCTAKIVKTPENMPENQTANSTKPSGALSGSPLGTYDPAYQSRVTGNFTGTTDEILQWGACKWGFDADMARAVASGLSKWKQTALADCNNQGQIQPETNGCQSVGIMRIKAANIPPTHGGTWPNAKTSTAFNVDYALGVIRACYEGKQSSLTRATVPYQAGDLDGCVGAWYSGTWHDGASEGFILGYKDIQQKKEWTTYSGGMAASGGTSGAQTVPNNPASNPAAVVTPSFYPLAPCPTCTSPSIAPVLSGVVAPTAGMANPTSAVSAPAPVPAPCVTNNSDYADNKHKKHKKHSGKLSAGMEVILQFLIKLLELLIQILGGGQIANPAPVPTTPGEPEPVPCTPSEAPQTQPTDIPAASNAPAQPSQAATPSTAAAVPSGTMNQATGNPTDATCTTTASTPSAPVTGYKLTQCEDFNGTTTGAFKGYDGGGEGTVVGGGRKASQCTAGNGMLTLTQTADGSTCGGSMDTFSQKYGYWEVRMKTSSTGSGGSAPHPVLILWPDTDWNDGELDFFETDLGDSGATAFLHCVGNPSQNCVTKEYSVDYTQWHVYGFEWTANGFAGYVDGKQVYTSDSAGANPTVNMHQTIQLDNLTGKTPVSPGKMEVDWVHMYSK